MSNFGPAPPMITAKISPSVDPRTQVASVRSAGIEPFGARGPSPLAVPPWQKAQYFLKAAAPAVTEAAVEATGFLTARAAGLPPGNWARTVATEIMTSAYETTRAMATRRMARTP